MPPASPARTPRRHRASRGETRAADRRARRASSGRDFGLGPREDAETLRVERERLRLRQRALHARAWLRWTSAMATPAEWRGRAGQRRRREARAGGGSCVADVRLRAWLAWRLAVRNSRSSSFSSGSCAVAQSPVVARRVPAEERARVAAERLPLLSGFGQPPVQEPALAVLVEPGAERRPMADERLVRDLDRVLADVTSRASASVRSTSRTSASCSRRGISSRDRRRAAACPRCPRRARSAAGRCCAQAPAARRESKSR